MNNKTLSKTSFRSSSISKGKSKEESVKIPNKESNLTKPKIKKKKTTKNKNEDSSIKKGKKTKSQLEDGNVSNDDNANESNLIPEVKITQKVDTLNRLINNSNEILNSQNNIVQKCEEMTKKITNSDYEIERQINKLENDDFPIFFDKYGKDFNFILHRLESHAEELQEIKLVKEENKNLKYKLELMSIDRNDSGFQIESKLNSLRQFLYEELNHLNDYIVDLGMDYSFHKLENSKLKSDENLREINRLRIEKNGLAEENRTLKAKCEDANSRKIAERGNETKTLEDDLLYYKSLCRDYETKLNLKDSRINIEPVGAESIRKDQPLLPDHLMSFRGNNYDNNSYNDSAIYRDMKYNSKFESQSYPYEKDNQKMNFANQSLENFRRNKDLRMSSNSNQSYCSYNGYNAYNEENLRLENKYSDSHFYKSEY